MASGDVTRRELILSASPNGTTGWYDKSFSETTIEGVIRPRGASIQLNNFHSLAKYPQTFFTPDVIKEGDEIIDANNDYYVIRAADREWWLDQFSHYVCNAEYSEFHADRPSGYGTGSDVDDSRYRTKVFIDAYVDDSALTKDNGSTEAEWLSCWSGFDYPLSMVMLPSPDGKDIDGIYAISPSDTTAYETYNHYAYKFREQVPITIYTVDKSGITAENLKNKMEQELRRVIGAYPTGSLRKLRSGRPVQVGVHPIYGYEYILEYTRPNDNFSPSYPTITWGPSASPTGTYIIPNVTRKTPLGQTNDPWLHPFGFSGDLSQGGGSQAFEFELECDLDFEPSVTSFSWKRPQTSSPKTDVTKYQVFEDIIHNEGINQDYHTLTFSATGPSLKVRLLRYEPRETSDGNMLVLRFREYRADSASDETIATRLGYS